MTEEERVQWVQRGGAALFVILSGEAATFIPYSSNAFIPNEGAARP